MRLTLRTLLAYLDDTLPPAEAAEIGRKLTANPDAQTLTDRIRAVTRRRGLAPLTPTADRSPADPNAAAEYLSDALQGDELAAFETACLADDAALAEVAAGHEVLTLVLSEQVKVPPSARRRMYKLVKGKESAPGRRPATNLSVATVREADPAADEEADAQLLLGLPAYSADESAARVAARVGAVAALLLGFGVCAWLAFPAVDRAPALPPAVAVAPAPVPDPAPRLPDPGAVTAPMPSPAPTAPPPKAEPPKVDPPKVDPPKVDAPAVERVAVGRFDPPAGGAPGVLARKAPDADAWERVTAGPGGVFTADRLVCLPGYRAALALDTGATLDLWGNLPELVPVPLLGASVTLHPPADGLAADLTVHAGRVYLSGRPPAGVRVRLRFAGQDWVVALPDNKGEAVFELVHLPGGERAVAAARLVTLSGPAEVTPAGGPAVKLERGAGLGWSSAGGPPQGFPPLARADRDQLARLTPSPAAAQPTVAALAELAGRPGGRVQAALDELVQAVPDSQRAVPGVIAGYRVGVYGLAALGDTGRLADLLASPSNPVARQTAAEALGPALAADPTLADPVRRLLVDAKKLTEAEAAEAVRLLTGEVADPDRLVAALQSPALPLRELALRTLIGRADPADYPRLAAPPFNFDVAGPDDARQAGVRAWQRLLDDSKKKPPAAPPKN